MALSSSESALLTQTCENMNVAANTCREVLEMLRSLGNTGVVDIATHDNASTAHANTTNLAKLQPSTGNLVIGSPFMDIPNWTGYNRLVAGKTSGGQTILSTFSERSPNSNEYFELKSWAIISDGNSNLATRASIASLFNNSQLVSLGRIGALGVDASGNRYCGIEFDSGCVLDTEKTHAPTSLRMYGQTLSGSYAFFYSFEDGGIIPYQVAALGTATSPFDTAYFRTAATVTSDRREKSGISAIGSEAVDFLKALRPVQFTVRVGRQNIIETDGEGNVTKVEDIPGVRHHWGLIAQEVQEALVSAGYDPSACAVWSLADKNDPDSRQALRYEELIAPMIKVIQQQQERIEALERKVA